MVVAFGLSWLLRDVPLRETAGSAGIGESFAAPRESSPSSGGDFYGRVSGHGDRNPSKAARVAAIRQPRRR